MARLMYRIALGIAAVTVAGGALANPRSTAIPIPMAASSTRTVPQRRREEPADQADGLEFHLHQRARIRRGAGRDRFPVTLYTFACGEVCQNA
jgi:hypothetical protein